MHTAKAAGRYVNHYMNVSVFGNRGGELARQRVKLYNSWYKPFLLQRDWTEQELLQLAAGRHPAQYPTPDEVAEHHRRFEHDYLARQFVHNHGLFWTAAAVDAFQRQDWMVFTFLREPSERLCSYWTWARAEVAAGTDRRVLLSPRWLIDLTLDAFIRTILTDPSLTRYYALPAYIDRLDHAAEFNAVNFAGFLKTFFDHDYDPDSVAEETRQASGNPGYAAFRARGQISDRTDQLLNGNEDVARVRDLLATGPRISSRYRDRQKPG